MAPKRRVPKRDEPRSPATLPAAGTNLDLLPPNLFTTELQGGNSSSIPAAADLLQGGGGGGDSQAVLSAGETSGQQNGDEQPLAGASVINGDSAAVDEGSVQPIQPKFIKLNVGGSPYATSTSTLMEAPDSLLAQWVATDFHGLPRGPDGTVYINRDGKTFRHILNYLRGYHVKVPQEDVALLVEDAHYYRLDRLMVDLGLCSPPVWQFKDGPGVENRDEAGRLSGSGAVWTPASHGGLSGSQFNTTTMVGTCGTEFFTSGIHMATFRVEKCEIVAIGCVSQAAEGANGTHFKNTPGCSCYLNTGEIFGNYNNLYHQQVVGAPHPPRFREGDQITIHIEYDAQYQYFSNSAATNVTTATTEYDNSGSSNNNVTGNNNFNNAMMLSASSPTGMPSAPLPTTNTTHLPPGTAGGDGAQRTGGLTSAGGSGTPVNPTPKSSSLPFPQPPPNAELMRITFSKQAEIIYTMTVEAVPLRFAVFIEGSSVVTLADLLTWDGQSQGAKSLSGDSALVEGLYPHPHARRVAADATTGNNSPSMAQHASSNTRPA